MVRQNLRRKVRVLQRCGVLIVVLLLPSGVHAGRSAQQPGVLAARHVLERTLGGRAGAFNLALVPARDSVDSFDVEAAAGRVTVHGTSPVALVRGAYYYLRTACHCMVSWSGAHIDLPDRLPDYPRTVVQTPYRFRQYFNVCTFGYTTVWWDWNRWEREIDWMALHGINMPLALVGQEGVWQRVWESFGLQRDSLRSFFTGPAFLPWHWMGNINRHGGPLPQWWIEAQEELQKKILGRMRELGMTPIVPAFSGFVPEDFRRLYPGERLSENVDWSSLPEDDRTFVLSPGSTKFQEIGARFIKEYRRTFGACQYYLADTFNELDVPVSVEHRYDELAGFGDAVYQSIHRGDSSGVWVMQGWLFSDRAAFWDAASTRALLSRVPDDRMIILDLANEEFHGWKVHKGFYGKQWIYSIIHNFGGNNPLRGNLPFVASDPAAMLQDGSAGHLVGYGLAPEGIENNEVVYELLTDMAWRSEPVNLQTWLHEYCRARYGTVTSGVDRAWELLKDAAYSRTAGHHLVFAFQNRPSLSPHSDAFTDPRIDEALTLLLDDADRFAGSSLFTNDLVDVAAYVVGNRIDRKLGEACRAHVCGDIALRDTLAHEADLLMQRLDALVQTRVDNRVEQWIGAARAEGRTAEEKNLMEANARRQITVWGGPALHEYAGKLWSGMVRDFYAPRWKLFFSLLGQGVVPSECEERLRGWDEEWWQRSTLSAAVFAGDPVKSIRELLATEQGMTHVAAEPVVRTSKPIFVDGDSAVVAIDAEGGAEIRYTLDGTSPDRTSLLYSSPIVVRSNVNIQARTFSVGRWKSPVASLTLRKVGRDNGLDYMYFAEPVSNVSDSVWGSLHGGRSGQSFAFAASVDPTRTKQYAVSYKGFVLIDTGGEYTFSTESDDGSRLYLDGACVVDNDGYHGAREMRGTRMLDRGYHAIEVRYFQGTGASSLKVMYEGPGVARQELPPEKLFLIAQ